MSVADSVLVADEVSSADLGVLIEGLPGVELVFVDSDGARLYRLGASPIWVNDQTDYLDDFGIPLSAVQAEISTAERDAVTRRALVERIYDMLAAQTDWSIMFVTDDLSHLERFRRSQVA